jgi:intraflagellar transport protein 52
VFFCRFTEHEIEELKSFVNKGGSLLFLVGEGGDPASCSNVNAVVGEYGITVEVISPFSFDTHVLLYSL